MSRLRQNSSNDIGARGLSLAMAYNMRNTARSVVILLSICAHAVGAEQLESIQPPDGSFIENASVLYRKDISTAFVRMEIHIAIQGSGETTSLSLDEGTYFVRNLSIWSDGENSRFDHIMPSVKYSDATDGIVNYTKDGKTRLHLIFTTSENIFYDSTAINKSNPMAASVTRNAKRNSRAALRMDFRCLGMIPSSFSLMHSRTHERFYGTDDRLRPAVTKEQLSGMEVLKTTFTQKDGLEFSAWVIPEKGYSVVRAEVVRESSSGKYQLVTECSLDLFDKAIWFPRKVEYYSYKDDSLVGRERIFIREAQFNQTIDPRMFTLAGLEMPSDTSVITKDLDTK